MRGVEKVVLIARKPTGPGRARSSRHAEGGMGRQAVAGRVGPGKESLARNTSSFLAKQGPGLSKSVKVWLSA